MKKKLMRQCYRILLLKNELGLFENPYKDADEQREKELFLCEGHRRTAREMVQKSAVLLKNEEDGKAGKLLPLNPAEKIAFIGPYIEGEDMRSSWVVTGSAKNSVSICQAAKEAFRDDQICFAKGCTLLDNDTLLNGSGVYAVIPGRRTMTGCFVKPFRRRNRQMWWFCVWESRIISPERPPAGHVLHRRRSREPFCLK